MVKLSSSNFDYEDIKIKVNENREIFIQKNKEYINISLPCHHKGNNEIQDFFIAIGKEPIVYDILEYSGAKYVITPFSLEIGLLFGDDNEFLNKLMRAINQEEGKKIFKRNQDSEASGGGKRKGGRKRDKRTTVFQETKKVKQEKRRTSLEYQYPTYFELIENNEIFNAVLKNIFDNLKKFRYPDYRGTRQSFQGSIIIDQDEDPDTRKLNALEYNKTKIVTTILLFNHFYQLLIWKISINDILSKERTRMSTNWFEDYDNSFEKLLTDAGIVDDLFQNNRGSTENQHMRHNQSIIKHLIESITMTSEENPRKMRENPTYKDYIVNIMCNKKWVFRTEEQTEESQKRAGRRRGGLRKILIDMPLNSLDLSTIEKINDDTRKNQWISVDNKLQVVNAKIEIEDDGDLNKFGGKIINLSLKEYSYTKKIREFVKIIPYNELDDIK